MSLPRHHVWARYAPVVQCSKIVQIQWESSFGDLFLKLFKSDGIRRMKVKISQTDQFINTHEVSSYVVVVTWA